MNFTRIYTDYKGEARNLYFAFGNTENLTIAGYKGSADKDSPEEQEIITRIDLSFPGGSAVTTLELDTSGNYTYKTHDVSGEDEIILNIDGINYRFELPGTGEYLYFVVAEDIQGEHYIISNEQT